MPSQLDTYSTAGSFTYTIPEWAAKIDVITLGGGAAGAVGGAGFGNGKGGGKGQWVTQTWERGVHIPLSTTTITGVVGAQTIQTPAFGSPAAGAYSYASSGTVTFGAAGTGGVNTTSTANSITTSYTHTTVAADNYLVVYLAAAGTSIGVYSGHTRTVTCDGVAMTSLGAQNCNGTTNGFIEAFGMVLPVNTASTKTISVTVAKSAVTYTALKSSSVSYSNVRSVSAWGGFGSSTVPSASLPTFVPGGANIGGIFAVSSTFSAYGQTSRYASNVAPPLVIQEDTASTFFISASLAATAAWGVVTLSLNPQLALGGAINAVAAVAGTIGATGESAGTTVYNGQSYVGGTGGAGGNSSNGQVGNAPGSGGGGGGGVLVGSTPGGAGAAGRVWIYAWGDRPAFFPMM